MSRRLLLSLLLLAPSAWAKPPEERNELPAPFNLQAVVLQKTVTLTWQWPKPEELPAFKEFGYEIKRQDGKLFFSRGTDFMDLALPPGSYSYIVRVRGTTKDKRVLYVSDWSASASGQVLSACAGPPTVTLSVESAQKAYSSISSLRMHIKGQATLEDGCTLTNVRYHLDTGTGINHGGPLTVDKQGRFDTFINAFGPDDEIPTGLVSFSLSATAENEAGPSTSPPITMDVNLQNPFAPR